MNSTNQQQQQQINQQIIFNQQQNLLNHQHLTHLHHQTQPATQLLQIPNHHLLQQQQQQSLLLQQQHNHALLHHDQQTRSSNLLSLQRINPVSQPLSRSATPTFSSHPQNNIPNGHRQNLTHLKSPSSVSSSLSPPKLKPSLSRSNFQNTSLDHPTKSDPYPPSQSLSSLPPNPTPRSSSNQPQVPTPQNELPPSSSSSSSLPSPSSSSSDIPPSPLKISPIDHARISRWAAKDQIHQNSTVHGQFQKRTNLFGDIYSEALEESQQDWLGDINSTRPSTRFRLQMPVDLETILSAGKRKNRPRLKFSKKELSLIANTQEILVPIRLEIEIEHWKLRDTFTWNLKEPFVTPEQFAIHLCEDLILPIQHFSAPIVSSIKEQLEEYKLHENFQNHLTKPLTAQEQQLNLNRDHKPVVSKTTNLIEPLSPPRIHVQTEDSWWNGWKQKILNLDDHLVGLDPEESETLSKKIKLEKSPSPQLAQSFVKPLFMDQVNENFRPIRPDSLLTSSAEVRDDELRISIILDIVSGNIHLTDRFEWDISQIDNSPELFATVYADDLGLSGEFKTAIAHSIREQIETYVKSLALVEHTNGYPVPNDELRYAFLQRVTDPIRTGQVAEFTPFLNLLNAEELDRQEKEHDREARRKRRQTRGRRGITLPDRESQRTVRNIVPIQGLDMVIPYQNENEDLIVPIQPFAQPFAIKESFVELTDSSETQPKKHAQISKEPLVPDNQLLTPNKATASRVSRRLRGATADVVVGSTPPKTADLNGGDVNQDDAPTPSNTGTPAATYPANSKKNLKSDPSTHPTHISSEKHAPGTQSRSRINWEALGLHDPMIDGVWHCSNCGCPEPVAIGRRKGLGGKDTLCGDCGRYMHRFKKNRPTMYNTSAQYHTSLKLEADKAKQAIADQEVIRKEKNKPVNQNLALSLNSKKRKKDSRSSLPPKSDKLRRTQDRSVSIASSTKSGESRDSSPFVLRVTNHSGIEKSSSKKRSRVTESSDASVPTTRAQKSLSKGIVLESPEVGNSPESNSLNNTRAQSRSGSVTTTKPLRANSRRGSMKTDQLTGKKDSIKTEQDDDQDVKPEQALEPSQPSPETKELGSKNPDKFKNGIKSPPPTSRATSQLPSGSRSGSVPAPHPLGGNKDFKAESRRSTGNGRLPPVSTTRRFEPPHWMVGALLNIKNSYPSDRVELISKAKKEAPAPGQPPVVVGCDWRLKCLDCPGKLYTVGPGESFTNFDVHLKNRQHRQKVDERLAAVGLPPSASSQQISPTTSTHQSAGISSSRSSQQVLHVVPSVPSSQAQTLPGDCSPRAEVPSTDQLSQPHVLSPSEQRVPATSNSPQNQVGENLEPIGASPISALHQVHAEVTDKAQISPTDVVANNQQSRQGSIVCLANPKAAIPSAAETTANLLSPPHTDIQDPRIHPDSFSDRPQVQNLSPLPTNTVQGLYRNPHHETEASSLVNPTPQSALPISSQLISPEVLRKSYQSNLPGNEATNQERVGAGAMPLGLPVLSGNNHTFPHLRRPTSSGGSYVNRPSSLRTTPPFNTTFQTQKNRRSSLMASTINNDLNLLIAPNQLGNNMSQSRSPSESHFMNTSYHSNQNGQEYFHPQHQILNSSNGIPPFTNPNSNLEAALIYNNNQNKHGHGNGQSLPPPNTNYGFNTTSANTNHSSPTMTLPTLVHPLPKKPTFD